MRWKNAPLDTRDRWVLRFAWLPVRFKDGTVVWLECYEQRQFHVGGYHWCDSGCESLDGEPPQRAL